MNLLKVFTLFIGFFIVLATINAYTIDPYNPNNNILINPAITEHIVDGGELPPTNQSEPDITVNIDEDVIYVEEDDTVDIEFHVKNTGGVAANVVMQFDQSDKDYEDYFTFDHLSKDTDVSANGGEEVIRFRLNVNHIPDDEYDVDFKIFVSYMKNDVETDFGEGSISVELNVDDYEDIDVKLEDDVICYGQDYPARTYLIFTNDTSSRYFIKNPDVESNEYLFPSVNSDDFEIERDEETKVPIYFRREAPLGNYEIEIDQLLHKGSLNSTDTRRLKKTLDVYVENCDSYYTSFNISPQTLNIKTNDKVNFNFSFYNNSNTEMPVYFKGTVNDSSMSVVFPKDVDTFLSNQYKPGTFSVLTGENTTSGEKVITLTAQSPYTTITKTVKVYVLKNDLSVVVNSIDIPVGLKGRQEISLQNNTGANVVLALTPIAQGQDIIILDKSAVTINAGSTATVYADIYPRSIGAKSYTLHISGSVTKDVVINFTSNSEAGLINFVSTYLSKANAVNNVWSTLSVVLENPYNFRTTLQIKLLSTDAVTSKTSTVILEPRQTKTVNVQYIVNTNEKNTRATLEVASDISKNTYPVYILISPDMSFTNALELTDAPTTIDYTTGTSTVTLKVNNSNSFAIKNATVKLLNADGNYLGYTTFNIGANATLDVKVNFVLESVEETTGSVLLTANEVENIYDVVYTKAGFMTTGLFNLGLGGTISILLGALIVILLIVYFTVRNPSIPEVQ